MRIKKIAILLLLLVAVFVGTASASSDVQVYGDTRASYYLSSYSSGLKADGGGKMTVSYTVVGTRTMDKIGVDKILIEYWDGSAWCEDGSVSGAKHPEFYAEDDIAHAGSYTFSGARGLTYRATVTAYAGNSSGSDTGSVTSYSAKCT